MKCPVDNCGDKPTTLVPLQDWPTDIAVDGAHIYWTTRDWNGLVLKCASGGCAGMPTTVSSAQRYPMGVAVDSTNAYWTDENGTVMKCAKARCAGNPTSLGTGALGPVVVDATNVYWVISSSSSTAIVKCAVGGCAGNPTMIYQGTQSFPWSRGTGAGSVAVDGTNVYWSDADRTISKCANTGCGVIAGGIPVKKTVVVPNVDADQVLIDQTSVYWFGPAGIMRFTPK